jgi:hypothetical protein
MAWRAGRSPWRAGCFFKNLETLHGSVRINIMKFFDQKKLNFCFYYDKITIFTHNNLELAPDSSIRIGITVFHGSPMNYMYSSVADPGSASTNLSIFNPKICFSSLGYMIRYPGYGSRFFTHPGSRGQKGTGSQIRNTELSHLVSVHEGGADLVGGSGGAAPGSPHPHPLSHCFHL